MGYCYSLAVLPSNVNNCPALREKVRYPFGMTANFCYLFVGKGDIDSSIAGSHKVGDCFKRKASLIEGIFHYPVGQSSLLRSGRPYNRGDDPVIHDHHLGHGRAYVNACKVV